MKILVAGDSFAAPWPGEYPSWVDLLSKKFTVTNRAEAGISEYKIYKQLYDIEPYDLIIVSHTSPSRVHTKQHPCHKKGLHKHCDLIYTDLEKKFDWFNPALKTAKDWFLYHYDDEYQIDIYKMIRKNIHELIKQKRYFTLTHLPISAEYIIEDNNLDFSLFWPYNKGNVNHYSKKGNEIVYEEILRRI
jgi:hypothetical protein